MIMTLFYLRLRRLTLASLLLAKLSLTSRSLSGLAIASSLLLNGCASQIAKVPTPEPEQVAPEPIPARDFDTQTLYALLVAELAGSRDRLDIMLHNYLQQAESTQDIGVTQRAAQLANYLQDSDATQKMASQWAALEPDNTQARYMAMASLADIGRYFEAFEHGRYLISSGHTPHGLDALAVKVSRSNTDSDTLASLFSLYQQLSKAYPTDAELNLGTSFLAYDNGQYSQSLAAAKQAHTINREYEQAYIQELRALSKLSPADAQKRLPEIIKRFPDNSRLRLQYARNLTESNLPAAAEQFEVLLKQSPNDGNLLLALGLTYYQNGQLDLARERLLLIENAPGQSSTARYYLGKIAQQQGKTQEAISYFSQVPPSSEFLPAMARAVELMHKNERANDALQLITGHQLTADNSYQEALSQLLADHYRSIDNKAAAEQAFNEGLRKFPRSEQLLLNRAMFYAGEQRLDEAVRDLNTLLAINPDNPDALNSLGYLLADANIRIDEAYTYIKRALELTPNNAAAIDSLGWVLYRMGKNQQAIGYLRQALTLMPNDEIAAHLGEVLWVEGEQNAAIQIWKDGLKLNPDSRFIHERLRRFQLIEGSNS